MSTAIKISDIRKDQIIEAALRKISEVGIQNITIDDIAAQAGMSKGGVTYYYSSKDELIREVFRSFFDRIFKRGRETMALFPDPLDKILSFNWLYDIENPDIKMGYNLLFDFMPLVIRDKECQQIYHEWLENWIILLKDAVVDGIKMGKFRESDPDNTARIISSIYHGISMRWYPDRASHPTEWAVKAVNESITRLMGVKI